MTLPVSARNRFQARVRRIVEAPVLSEIEVETADGLVIIATMSTRQIGEMNLQVGGDVLALLKANDVSLAVL